MSEKGHPNSCLLLSENPASVEDNIPQVTLK